MSKKKVIVGMSGGVDSSVSALLLKEQGFEVIGLFMKNWDEKDPAGKCLAAYDQEDALKIADQLKIPCYTVNFVQEYWDNVFSSFLSDLKAGYTPNPDILCNREIKFKAFLEKALSLGADFLATGHWAQTKEGKLLRSVDTEKDQTYFLYTLKEKTLGKVLFPIGHLKKPQLREIARRAGLATAEKKDSTGICFIGERNFSHFLSSYIPYQSGNFETLEGKIVGKHRGVAYYTLGQRKGLAIGGQGEAWFVVGKDVARNVVVVEQGSDHPALYKKHLVASEESWVGKEPQFPLQCTAKIRYRQQDQACLVEKRGDVLFVLFETPQRAVTPRQSIVFYDQDVCLGGALIADETTLSAGSN